MKFNKIIIICIAALILAVTPVVIAEVQRNTPITVKTELKEGEFVSRVKLSRGEIFFKTQEELTAQLTAEDYTHGMATSAQYPTGGKKIVYYPDMNGGKRFTESEIAEKMNLHPELWKLNRDGAEEYVYYYEPCFFDGDREKRANLVTFEYRYYYGGGVSIDINAAPTPVKYALENTLAASDGVNSSALSLRVLFGDLDSSIGDIRLAVKVWHDELNYDGLDEPYSYKAFFTVENTAYQIYTRGISQREFTELLISICSAPHSETQSVIDYVLQQ